MTGMPVVRPIVRIRPCMNSDVHVSHSYTRWTNKEPYKAFCPGKKELS